ncbi:hypothetical protein L7F22_021942 [Adiantum nelumboides]|nr:hypothetical protein [Adiantum nelumboides]
MPLDEGLVKQAANSFNKNTCTVSVKGRTIQFSPATIEHIFQLPNAPDPKTCIGEAITIYLQETTEQLKKRKAIGQGIPVDRLQNQKAYKFAVEALGMKSNGTYVSKTLFGMLLAREQDPQSPINLENYLHTNVEGQTNKYPNVALYKAGYVWQYMLYVTASKTPRPQAPLQITEAGEEEEPEGSTDTGKRALEAVIGNGPFEKWGIDAMGPLPRTTNGKLYILVAIDYMTRWVEAQSVARVNEKIVSKFVYTHICCKFGTPLGTPLEIVSNNGPGFRKGLLTEVCEELKISHRHSTPYYSQSNGLVEKANGIIASIIEKMVESKPKHWDNFLDGAIWAYRITYRDATQFIPFHLVYGQDALQPIELNISTIKLTGRQKQNIDGAWINRLLTLAELEWKREAAYHCYERMQIKDKLNEGLKDKEIKEKSLVLRYNNALDNTFDAKFERRWEVPFIVKKAFTSGYYQLMDLNGKEHPRKVNGYRLKPYLSHILPAVFETKQVSKKTKKVCFHCFSSTHQVKSCAFQHVLHEVAKDQKAKLSSPTNSPDSSFQCNPVDGT